MVDLKIGTCEACGMENVAYISRCICGSCFSLEIDKRREEAKNKYVEVRRKCALCECFLKADENKLCSVCLEDELKA